MLLGQGTHLLEYSSLGFSPTAHTVCAVAPVTSRYLCISTTSPFHRCSASSTRWIVGGFFEGETAGAHDDTVWW